jgi:hypothetical protein
VSGPRRALLVLALLLAAIRPGHAHGFLLVDVIVATADGGRVEITIVTDRAEAGLAQIRAGRLAAELLPAAGEDEACAAFAPRLGEVVAAQLALADRHGRALLARDLTTTTDGPMLRLRLRVDAGGGVRARLALHPGHEPPPAYRIRRGGAVEPEIRHEGDEVELAAAPPPAPLPTLLARSARQGFLHVLPWGFDHVLFVLGLALSARGWRHLLALVSTFTVAHSLTLGGAATGLLPTAAFGTAIEVIIALSLVAVAFEAARPRREETRRDRLRGLALVFGFGLAHGLGFAGALANLGLSRDHLLPMLVGFNLGVEGGQLATIALAWLIGGWTRSRPWHRRVVVIPASLLIAGFGLFWAVQRAFG